MGEVMADGYTCPEWAWTAVVTAIVLLVLFHDPSGGKGKVTLCVKLLHEDDLCKRIDVQGGRTILSLSGECT